MLLNTCLTLSSREVSYKIQTVNSLLLDQTLSLVIPYSPSMVPPLFRWERLRSWDSKCSPKLAPHSLRKWCYWGSHMGELRIRGSRGARKHWISPGPHLRVSVWEAAVPRGKFVTWGGGLSPHLFSCYLCTFVANIARHKVRCKMSYLIYIYNYYYLLEKYFLNF